MQQNSVVNLADDRQTRHRNLQQNRDKKTNFTLFLTAHTSYSTEANHGRGSINNY